MLVQSPVLVRHTGPVTDVHFSPTAPHSITAAASAGVHVYKPKSSSKQKTISRFKDIAYSPQFRGTTLPCSLVTLHEHITHLPPLTADGKLLAVGGEQKMVQVFEMATRSILRQYKGHSKAVHVNRWSADGHSLASGSDDTTVKLWDLKEAGQATATFKGHTDYVRALAAAPNSSQVWASGGYDHLVKCWDARMDPGEDGNRAAYLTLDHGAPVEALLYFPSGNILVSAGGDYMKVWDVLGGGAGSQNLLHSSQHHLKAMTSLCLDGSGSRLLTGSLDCHVKVLDVSTYNVTYALKFSSPVLSVGLSPDNACLAVGMNDGMLGIRHRREPPTEDGVASRPQVEHAGSHRWQLRGKNLGASAGDLSVVVKKKAKLRPYDKYLKSFQFQMALNAVLDMKTSVVTVSLLEDLNARGALQVALSGRDEETLAPLLEFLMKNITNPNYSTLLIDITNRVLDMYTPILGQSEVIDELFVKLRAKVATEVKLQKELQSLTGMISLIMGSISDAPAVEDLA